MNFKLLICIFTWFFFGFIDGYSQDTFVLNDMILQEDEIHSMDNEIRLSYLSQIENVDQALDYFLWVFRDFIGNTTGYEAEFSYSLYEQYGDSYAKAIEDKIRSIDLSNPYNEEIYARNESDLFTMIWSISDLMYDKDVQYFFTPLFANFLENRMVDWINYQGEIDMVIEHGTWIINRIRYNESEGPYGYITEDNLRSYYAELMDSGALSDK